MDGMSNHAKVTAGETRAGTSPKADGLAFMWRALNHRNFRLFFGGQGISLIGTWMTRIATSWVVFRLAGPAAAAIWLGVVGFVGQIPTFLLSPVGGVLVDRWDRHRLLVVTQTLSMIQSFGLALAVFIPQPNTRTILEIMFLNVFQGVINAFDTPGRQAFLVDMVTEKGDLANAIVLNSSLVNSARLLGPSIAGVLIALVGEFWCFFLDGVSYIAVILALLAMRLEKSSGPRRRPAHWRIELKEGFTYVVGFLPIRVVLTQLAVISLMGMSYTVLMPIFAHRIQANSSSVMGFMMGASGVGALVGVFYLATRKSVLGLGKVIACSSLLFGVSLILFSQTRNFYLSLILLMGAGGGMMTQMAASNTILQTIVDEDKRGRVMSFYTMALLGMAPFGSLFAGSFAKLIGAPATVSIGGACCVLGGIQFWRRLPTLRKFVRPIYERLGILPEVAAGIAAAAKVPTA
jgi:MFS family permease